MQIMLPLSYMHDVGIYNTSQIDSDGDTELVGFSHTHVNLDPCLQLSLEAGM